MNTYWMPKQRIMEIEKGKIYCTHYRTQFGRSYGLVLRQSI